MFRKKNSRKLFRKKNHGRKSEKSEGDFNNKMY